VNALWRRLTRPLPLITGVAGDLLRTRRELIAENALLRQQLIVASRKIKGPAFHSHERGLLLLLARLVPRSGDALLLVKPETLLRWHFRSRRERGGRSGHQDGGTGAPDEFCRGAISPHYRVAA